MSYAKKSGDGYGARVSLVPSIRGRNLARVIPGAYQHIWEDLNRCVSLASIPADALTAVQQQLTCHALFALTPSDITGGPTWDMEAWYASIGDYLNPVKRCHYPLSSVATSAYDGWIVQWAGDTKAQKTSWLVVNKSGLVRNHIETTAMYACLKAVGKPGPIALDGNYLSAVLPDEFGVQAGCSPLANPTPPGTPTPPPTGPPGSPPPAPTTWAETTGGEAHTWTNYTNAGGYEGPVIPAHATVQIACRLEGFRVADGNVWWYRIAQSPWNGTYYVSADAFYNNGATSGSLHGTPFYDVNVAHC